MRRIQIGVIAGAIEIGRHRAQELRAVLLVIRGTHLYAGDLGDGVGLAGFFERAGEQGFLLDRLRAIARVDTAGTEEDQARNTALRGLVDHVGLDGEVLVDEFGRVGIVGKDATDFGGGEDDVVGFFARKKFSHGARIDQIEFGVGARDEIGVAVLLQAANDGRTGKAAVAGDVDFLLFSHWGVSVVWAGAR